MNGTRPVKYEEIISLRLPAAAARQLRELAEADDRPPGALARRLILRGLEDSPQPTTPDPIETT